VAQRDDVQVVKTKVRRLGWAGRLVGMSGDKTVKKRFVEKPGGRRKAGRPNLRCLDCIENHLKWVSVKRWRETAEDRSTWAIILKEAPVKM